MTPTQQIAALDLEIKRLSDLCDCDCDNDDCVRCSHYPTILENKRKERATLDAVQAQAEVEPVAAPAVTASDYLDAVVSKSPDPLKHLGQWLANLLDEDDWPTAERYLNAAAIACQPATPTVQDAARVLLADRAAWLKMADEAEASHATGVSFNVAIGDALRAIAGGEA